MNLNEQLEAAGVDLVHHFVGGVYAKETHIPRGVVLTQHVHQFDHLSVLASGNVKLTANGWVSYHQGPAALKIAAGVAHEVEAMTDAVWYCIHATNETDPEKVDGELIA